MRAADIEVRTSVDPSDLTELYAAAWWAADRTEAGVAHMLARTDLLFGLIHRPDNRLVGFARVLTDGVYLALILDVIVAPDVRGHGLGALLLDTVLAHPVVAGVSSVELVCQPDLLPFYRKWGFTDEVGRSTLVRRPRSTLDAPVSRRG